jgi:hypothetical protein
MLMATPHRFLRMKSLLFGYERPQVTALPPNRSGLNDDSRRTRCHVRIEIHLGCNDPFSPLLGIGKFRGGGDARSSASLRVRAKAFGKEVSRPVSRQERRWVDSERFDSQAVADTPHGLCDGRVVYLRTKLLPELGDVSIHGSCFNEDSGSPYQFQQFFTAVDSAGLRRQDPQQGTFSWGEMEGSIVQTAFVAVSIDDQWANGKSVLF